MSQRHQRLNPVSFLNTHQGLALHTCTNMIGSHYIPALDISTGPLHFSDRRTSSGQCILSFTGPYGPPRYMSGHQISNSAGPNDDESQYILFAWAPVPHLGSCRAVLLLQRDASVASRSQACQSNILTSVFR